MRQGYTAKAQLSIGRWFFLKRGCQFEVSVSISKGRFATVGSNGVLGSIRITSQFDSVPTRNTAPVSKGRDLQGSYPKQDSHSHSLICHNSPRKGWWRFQAL